MKPGYKHLFGPVKSRRLGTSLGVDMVRFKTCSLNCIYCECGATTDLTISRKEYVPADSIINELQEYLSSSPDLDYITFGGSGEPTLNTGLGRIVRFLKQSFPQYKTALLTNGTLFYIPEVRADVLPVDLVLPSLDAISGKAFADVNRPHGDLDNGIIIDGLVSFRKEYKGTIWLEVFIVQGLNDTPEELAHFKSAISRFNPDRVQLNSLDRPGAVDWIRPAELERLKQIAEYLLPLPVEIISRSAKEMPSTLNETDSEEAILSLVGRRPCTLDEIAQTLGRTINDTLALLQTLRNKGLIVSCDVGGRTFLRSAQE